MSEQPEALRVADALEVDKWHVAGVTLQTAAELLREQHAEIERLRAEREEDQGVIAVWRGRTQRAEAEIERLRAEQLPTPPEECQTEAEKKAFAFGWYSGVAAARSKP